MYCGYGHVCGPYTCGKYKEKPEAAKVPPTSDGKSLVK